MVSTSCFGKQTLRYFLFLFLSLFSVNLYAYFEATNSNTKLKGTGSTPLAACQTVTSAKTASNGFCYIDGIGSRIDGTYREIDNTCPTAGTVDVKSVPFRLRNSQVCISSCLWNPSTSGGMVCGEGSGICATDFVSAGTPCSQNTDLTPTQQDKDNTKTPEEPMQCSSAYCNNPDNKACPSGYTKGSFNGKSICVKNSPNNPNPNDPNNNPDANGGGDGRCNGTNNCNTNNYDFDVSQIVNAISSQTAEINSSINSAIQNLSDGIKTSINSLGNKLESIFSEQKTTNQNLSDLKNNTDKTNEKLDKVNANLDKSNGHLDQIEKNGKETNENLNDIKEFLNEDYEHQSGNTALDIGDSAPVEVDTSISFAGYCPAPITVPIHFAFVNTSMEFSYTRYCDLAQFIKPVVIALASFFAALIIGGVRTGE